MILYSINIYVKKKTSTSWELWMREKHIPDIMNTGLFSEFEFNQIDESDNFFNYKINYKSKSIRNYLKYQRLFAINLQKEHAQKFENEFTATRSLFIKC